MVKALIFDMGGVLVWDLWEHLFLDEDGIASLFGLSKKDARKVGEDLWEQFAYRSAEGKHWQELEREYWELVIRTLHLPVDADNLIELSQKFIRPISGMGSLVQALNSQGIELGICSNNTEFWFERQMDALKLRRFFTPSKIILSCRIGSAKKSDDLEMFRAVGQALTADLSECLLVDDRPENVEKALKCRMTGVLFPSHKAYGSEYLYGLLAQIGILR